MDGLALLKLMPKAVAFFSIDELPGVITQPDNQGWIFEGGNPRPITRSEALGRGAVTVTADDAAELFNMMPDALDFLKKNENHKSSIEKIKPAMTKDDLQMKAKVVKSRDTSIPAKE